MGMFWQFFAFEQKRWDAVFGGGYPKAEKLVIASAIAQREENLDLDFDPEKPGEWLDTLDERCPDDVREIAHRFCTEGVSYAGLSGDDLAMVDEWIVGWFSPEGLENPLEYRIVHRDGMSNRAVRELLGRAKPGFFGKLEKVIPQLSAFDKGRRFGSTSAPVLEVPYFIYNTEQAAQALKECEGLIAASAPWRTPGFRAEVETELLPGLRSAVEAQQWFAARYT
jgi:hypothetical protein